MRRSYRGKDVFPYNIVLLISGMVLLLLAAAILMLVPHARFLALLFCCLGVVLLICFFLGSLPTFTASGAIVKWIRMVILLVLAVWFISFIVVETLIIIDAITTKNSEGSDYLVVLGAGLYGSTPSPSLKSRLDETLVYASENPDTIIIVTGGQGKGENITESRAMFTYLVEHGIDRDRIIQEDKATSTLENIRFSLNIIDRHWDKADDPKIAVLSNEYHLFRTKLIAAGEGQSVTLVAAETPMISLKFAYYAREYFALLKYLMFG